MKILVIDDSLLDQIAMKDVLEAEGYEVVLLETADRCMEVIDREKPSLVLLDVVMPGMDGRELLRLIREKYSPVVLRVIIVTSRADVLDVVEFLEKGANDYIVKPVNYAVTLMRITTQLKLAELSDQLVRNKEIEAVSALIATYNHEINNPLSIAIELTKIISEQYPQDENSKNLTGVLWRIAEIVKKIQEVQQSKIEFEAYTSSIKTIKI